MAKAASTPKLTAPPKVLTPYQREIAGAEWYHRETGNALVHTLEKARRIGGSTAGAYWASFLCVGRRPTRGGETFDQHDPMDVFIVSKDWLGAKNLLREVVDACSSMAELDPDFDVDPTATCVTFKSTGKRVVALPCRAETIRSNTGAMLCDEVAFWRRMEDTWGAAKVVAGANLKVGARGYPILAITTPWDSASLACRLFTDPEFPFVRHRVDIYDAQRDGFPIDIEATRAELGIPELFASEFECSWNRGSDTFFPLSKLRDCQDDELPDGWQDAPAFFGIDVGGGKGRDNTACVQWRAIGDDCWMTGLKAFNNLDHVEQCDTVEYWVVRDTNDSTPVVVGIDAGIMGGPMITELKHRFAKRKRVKIVGLNMSPADQERYATTTRRALEHGRIKLYTGDEAGGDERGSSALMLELSMLKARPGVGGRFTFATPRDPSKGHCDRAWAAMFGLSRITGAGSVQGVAKGGAGGYRPETAVHTVDFDRAGIG